MTTDANKKVMEEELRALGRALPLASPWTLHAHHHRASLEYTQSFTRIGRATTVAEFWNLFNYFGIDGVYDGTLAVAHETVMAFSLFRDGVRPEWEDEVNARGSEWGCREELDRAVFGHLWLEFVLGAVGEQLPHVVGVRAINKSNRYRILHKIEVWLDTTDDAAVRECREALNRLVPDAPAFTHMLHEDKQTQANEYNRRRQRGALRSTRDEGPVGA